jgi:signal-transduction protein with cAMP-binding, CBS, and nucleotidyltransferase domain
MMDGRALAAQVDGATLSASDLALFCGANPAQLLREIATAGSAAELAALVELAGRLVLGAMARPSDVDDCARMATEFVAAAAATCIRLAVADAAEAGFSAPKARMAWFAYGALARGEMLRFVPPKLGVVFDDSTLGDTAQASIYGAIVAGRVSEWLHKCGLTGEEGQWPEGSHECMARSAWERFFSSTIHSPIEHDVFARREFFDMRPIAGDGGFIGELESWLAGQLGESDLLVPLLAIDTMGNLPPLTFFSGLVVALDGSERAGLDLAATALQPIADAARVFGLASGRKEMNTLERLAAAGSDEVFQDAAEAYRIALFHQALSGGGRMDPSKLARLDQRLLKTAFTNVLRLLELTTHRFITA